MFKNTRTKAFVIVLCFGFFLAGAFAMSSLRCLRTPAHASGAPGSSMASPARPAGTKVTGPAWATTGNTAIADVAARALPGVVSIATTRIVKLPENAHPFFDDPFFRRFFGRRGKAPRPNGRLQGLGSGVIVSSDGILLTNNHVVSKASQILVTTSDRRQFKANVVGSDPRTDLAVLKIKGNLKNLHPIPMGDSDRLRLGEIVLAIGNPFGMSQTVTMGIVSAKGRANMGIVDYEDFLQTDAAINPGNSGGALLNMEGKLIGIPTAILSRTGGYQGIGLAIPISMVKPVMRSLIKYGKVRRGWLGVYIQDITPALSKALKLRARSGALVSQVQKKSPAHKAGIRRDDVIVAMDGKTIDSAGKLRNLVALKGPNTSAKLRIERGGKDLTVSVKLGALPSDRGKVSATSETPAANGLAVKTLTKELRSRLKVPSWVKGGVVVTEVEQGSTADLAGIRVGEIIVEVDRIPVADEKAFRSLLRRAVGQVLLRVVGSSGGSRYVVMTR